MTPLRLHTRLLLKYITMTMAYDSALMLMVIVYMTWYRVGFAQKGSTLELVHFEPECVIAW